MRNSELVGIARKLEEKAKRLQEEKDILEVTSFSLFIYIPYVFSSTGYYILVQYPDGIP